MPRITSRSGSFGHRVATRAGLVLTLALAAVVTGCAGQTARMDLDSEDDALLGGIGSKDFRSVCFEMAQSMVRLPQIQNAAKPPTIAFVDMVNNSDEILNADDLLYKMRTELIKNSGGKMVFLDRDIIEQIRTERRDKQRGQVERRIGLFDQQFHADRTRCRSRRHYEARRWTKVLSHNLSRHLNGKLRRPPESLAHLRLVA